MTVVAALEGALLGGQEPERDTPRLFAPLDVAEFLLMPAQSAKYAGIKVGTVAPGNPARGHPKIQGTYWHCVRQASAVHGGGDVMGGHRGSWLRP